MRRIAAIVLPELACEIAHRDHHAVGAFAVIVDEDEITTEDVVDKSATLHAVSRDAWRYGARPGQTASQAAAYVGELNVLRISKGRILETLGALAELCLGFGTNAALTLRLEKGQLPLRDDAKAATLRYPLGAGAGPHDTVWLDVTGCAKLLGGEDVLAAELQDRARELGHRSRVSIADGPRIARALARWAPSAHLIAPAGDNQRSLHELPVAALPLSPDMITWLGKLGILRIDDLAQLDRARLSHRLGPSARDLLEVIAGRDPTPLRAYQPPRRIVESTTFEHEIASTEPLLFVLRGLCSRAISRLSARGEACARAGMRLGFDRSIVLLKNQGRSRPLPLTDDLMLDLPVPLSRENELMRALTAKLETTTLAAPVVSLSLVLEDLTEKNRHQLELGGRTGVDPSALPTLLAELNAHLGGDRVGVLEVVDQHRPEARSKLVAVDPKLMLMRSNRRPKRSNRRPRRDRQDTSTPGPSDPLDDDLPARILPDPIPIPEPERGALVVIDQCPFIIERLRHTARLDHIDWWSPDPLNRDYARAWMVAAGDRNSENACEAWIFIDRRTGRAYLQGWFE